MYNVFSLCQDKGDYYEVDPALMYPETIERIQEVLRGDEAPEELNDPEWTGIVWHDPVIIQFIKDAQAVTDWDSANGLAVAQSWFKRALVTSGQKKRIHILKDENYKR